MIATSLVSPFMAPLKLALFVALFLAMPYVLYQAWAFVAPGLYKHEKRFAIPLVVSSIVLFYARRRVRVLRRVSADVRVSDDDRADRRAGHDGHHQLPGFRAAAVLRVRHRVRDARRHRAARRHRPGARRDHDQESRLRAARDLRHRGVPHAAGCAVADRSWPCRCSCSTRSASSCRASCCRNAWRSSAAKNKARAAERPAERVQGCCGVYTFAQLGFLPRRALFGETGAPLQHPCH